MTSEGVGGKTDLVKVKTCVVLTPMIVMAQCHKLCLVAGGIHMSIALSKHERGIRQV